jgi:hypothetical protein
VIDILISAVRAGELDDLFNQGAKTGSIGKTRKAASTTLKAAGSVRRLFVSVMIINGRGLRSAPLSAMNHCHFGSTPSIPTPRKLAYLLPTSASSCFSLT